jgi:prepilin-type N-terminal cleavage/methylation domain-containing protein
MKINTSQRGGFTLVEIMIVVAIIGMLATIAIPNFVRARGQAQTNACISNLRQIDSAVNTWALETKQSDDTAVTFTSIAPYLRGSVVCPSGGKNFGDSYQLGTVVDKPTCKKEPAKHKLPDDTVS